jgi:phage-related tail fiber protein
VKATVGLLESCHHESLNQANEFQKARRGEHIRLVFAKPITAWVNNEQIEFAELMYGLPMKTGGFWVRTVRTTDNLGQWRRYGKCEFEKAKLFRAWLREARPAD